jgi:hypothetical protein
MAPWTFDTKFSLGTQFTFRSLTFVVGEDGDLKMLPPGPAPEHPTPTPPSTSGGTCLGSDPFVGLYIHTAKLIQGIPIMTSTLWTFIGAPSSSSSVLSPVEIHLISTPRSGPVPVRNSQRTTVSSLWWPQMGIGPATALVGIPLLKDQRRPMSKPLARGWFKIYTRTSISFGSRRSWTPSSVWHLMVPLLHSWLSKRLRRRTSL